MILPPGIYHNQQVCKLEKGQYGLKQAPQAWSEKFSIVSTSLGFRSNDHDSTLFLMTNSRGCILHSIYVDYMIIKGGDVDWIVELKLKLAKQLEMKELDTICYFFFGIEVAYIPRGYLLSQSKEIIVILEHNHILILHEHIALLSSMWNILPLMMFLYRISLRIVLWLTAWCIIILIDLILLMQCMLSVSLFLLLQWIKQLFFAYFSIFEHSILKFSFFLNLLLWNYMLTRMQIGLVIPPITSLLQSFAFF